MSAEIRFAARTSLTREINLRLNLTELQIADFIISLSAAVLIEILRRDAVSDTRFA